MPWNLYNYIYRLSVVLRVYWHCPFSCATENEAMTAILILSILINHSYFQLNVLNRPLYVFPSLLALSVFICDHEAMVAI